MEIEIKKLTPELAEDYVHFFDVTPHNFNECICYCVTWRSDNSYAGDAIIGFLHRRREESAPFSLLNPAAYRGILPIAGTRLWDGATPTQIAGSV